MGTNFYIGTANKATCEKYFGWDYELTDIPTWLYQQHVAKTSAGWVPLFQSHDSFKSVKQLKKLYDTGDFILYDEYGITYTWDEFDERVLKFNGGISGVQKKEKLNNNPQSPFYDPHAPEYGPISHCSGSDCTYSFREYGNEYFKDEMGYEFTSHEFS